MDQNIIIKICVMGELGVGKTSMLSQYIHKKFDEKVRTTIGCDFSTKLNSTIDGKIIRLQFWDIAGQERFNAVSKMYLRGALGCVIVCSASEKGTLDETLRWKKIAEENSDYYQNPSIPCLLVQNKSDVISLDNPQTHQTVEFLQKFSKANGFCGFIHTSAKDNKNLEEAFRLLLNEAMKREDLKGKIQTLSKKYDKQGASEREQKSVMLKNSKSAESEKQKKKCC